jgi:adenosylcobyric acid synthase
LLRLGLGMIEERTGVPVLAVVSYLRDLRIADEDAVSLESRRASGTGALDVAVIKLPHIANFDDIDPLEREPDVRVRYIEVGAELGSPDLVVIPGTKTTLPDLRWLHERGLAKAIQAYATRGGAVLGLCGGYQMLGCAVHDPDGVESEGGSVDGLGILPIETRLTREKATHLVEGESACDAGLLAGPVPVPLRGYEIHMGRTRAPEGTPVRLHRRSGRACQVGDGATSPDGWVLGTYVHGLLDNDALRARMLSNLAERRGVSFTPGPFLDRGVEYDRLAGTLREAFDVPALYRIAGLVP